MMNLAWAQEDTTSETRAYENLAVDYFYLGEIDKSEYYHERFMRGKTENSASIAKSVAINQIVQKRKLRMMDSSLKDGYSKRKDSAARLPSPSGMAKGTFSKSISLLPNYTEFESQKFAVFGA